MTAFVSVKCNQAAQKFKVLVTESFAPLDDHWTHGQVCPDQMTYYSWVSPLRPADSSTSGSSGSSGSSGRRLAGGAVSDDVVHVRFTLNKHTGDAAAMTRVGHSIQDVPLKLQPPFLTLDASGHDFTIDLCNIPLVDIAYLAVNGGHHCAQYEVKAQEISASECVD
jgi:hypothetical protein